MSKINYNTDVEYDTEKEKKFRITRGMAILAGIILIILIILIIVIVNMVNKKRENTYTDDDFSLLERRMEEEAPIYVDQKQVVLTEEEYRIDLDELLMENGGTIDSSRVKAVNVCEGYVIAKKLKTQTYEPYISCGDLYTTSGYITNDIEEEKTTITTKDTQAPNIVLKGSKVVNIRSGEAYTEHGFVAIDNIDGDITSRVKVNGTVDTNKAGQYTLIYIVSDESGNVSEKKRIINVVNDGTTTIATTTRVTTTLATTRPATTTKKITTQKKSTTTSVPKVAPTITLYGSRIITLYVGDTYRDPGYSATDCMGANITADVDVTGSVNTRVATTYYINYAVTDKYGNKAITTRTIIVKVKKVPVSGISISPNNVILSPGTSRKLEVFISPSNATNKTIVWTSSNNSVATISDGVITARAKGVATITAKTSNEKSYSVRVEVK